MFKLKIPLIALAVSSAIGTLALVLPLQTKPADAAYFCQCTEYVRNRFGLSSDIPNAKDWNDGYLQRNGFVQIAPKVGAIVVMEAQFPGADPTYGHVGVVESIDGYGRITVRGANQYIGTGLVTESNCTDVRSTQFRTSVNGRNDISFWEKGGSTTPISMISSRATGRVLDSGGANGTQAYLYPYAIQGNPWHLWKFVPYGDSYYIISTATGRVLDSGGANGTQAYLYPYLVNGNPWHLWKLVKSGDSYFIISKATGRVLDSGGANGTQFYLYPYPINGNPWHLWKLNF